MCLSIPAKILETDGLSARADMGGNVVRLDLSLVPDARPGDYVLVHAGFAIEKYDSKEEAEIVLGYFQEMGMASGSRRNGATSSV